MRPTKSSKHLVGSFAVIAAALLVHSLASAATFKSSYPCQVPELRNAIVQQVNAVRARGYNCGGEVFKAAQPVTWNDQLLSAAIGHSVDMAENNYFDHRSPHGVKPSQRVSASGYKWRGVGENIAAGAFTTRTVMQGWLDSPGHCRNIMDPAFHEIGVACVAKPGTTYGEYWTMVLGRRR